MLTSLRLVNWRSHADTLLEFKDGTNLLMGIMGSGKSSVLSAICFALFGTFPELERRKLRLEDILRLNESSAALVLELNWDGNKYKIERKISKEKRGMASDATAYKNNQTVEKGAVAVTSYVEQLLQVDYDLFTRAIYSEQNNIDYFLTVDPRKRKEEMDILLGLDKFEIARANAVGTINKMKSERKIYEDKFSKLEFENLKQRSKENNDRLILLETQIKKQKEEFEETETAFKERQKTYNELNAKKQTYDDLVKQRIILESTVDHLKKEIIEFDESKLVSLKNEKSKVEGNKNKAQNDIKNIDQELFKLNKEIASAENKINNSKRSKQEVASAEIEITKITNGSSIDQIKNMLGEHENKLVSYFSEKKSIENELRELVDVNEKILAAGACPFCGSEINEANVAHIKEEREKKIDSKNKRLKELEEITKEIKTNHEKEAKRLKQLEQFYEKINILKRNLEDTEALEQVKKTTEEKLLENQKKKDDAQKTNEEFTKQLQNLAVGINKLETLLAKKKNLAESEEKLKNVCTALEDLAFNEKIYEETRSLLEEMKVKFQKISSEKIAYEKELTMLDSMKEVLTSEIGKLEKMEEEISKLTALEEELIIYKNALLETQITLRSDLTEAINSAMNEIWHIFYPYRDYKALRLNVTEKDYLFEVFDGEWKTLESVASGGERACAALTLRVALAMVLTPNLSMLILDEPTHNLDKEAVELLSQTLQFKVPEVVEQTFVITHEEALMGSEFASSYKLSRNKEGFEATKVEKI